MSSVPTSRLDELQAELDTARAGWIRNLRIRRDLRRRMPGGSVTDGHPFEVDAHRAVVPDQLRLAGFTDSTGQTSLALQVRGPLVGVDGSEATFVLLLDPEITGAWVAQLYAAALKTAQRTGDETFLRAIVASIATVPGP